MRRFSPLLHPEAMQSNKWEWLGIFWICALCMRLKFRGCSGPSFGLVSGNDGEQHLSHDTIFPTWWEMKEWFGISMGILFPVIVCPCEDVFIDSCRNYTKVVPLHAMVIDDIRTELDTVTNQRRQMSGEWLEKSSCFCICWTVLQIRCELVHLTSTHNNWYTYSRGKRIMRWRCQLHSFTK
jgi:hypothetical protein